MINADSTMRGHAAEDIKAGQSIVVIIAADTGRITVRLACGSDHAPDCEHGVEKQFAPQP